MDGRFTLGNPDLDGDDDYLFNRIDSGDIIYSNPALKYKLIGPYIIGTKLGEGSYAKVKECLHSVTLQRCAVKIMKQKTLRKIPHGTENVNREIRLLRKLHHNNIINLCDVHYNTEKGKIYMMMEYCVAGLQEMLDKSLEKKFPFWQAHGYFVQLLDGLEFLHSQGVIHKDIKPGNLLLTNDSTLKIIDFGVAEQLDIQTGSDLITQSQGSPMFQPPEVAGGTYNEFPGFKLDVWSAGCTLFNLVSGDYPFNGINIFRIFESVCNDDLVIPEDFPETLGDLLKGMLIKDPFDRISLKQIRKHNWVDKRVVKQAGDAEISLFGKTERDVHACTVIPYLQAHHYPEDTPEYMTERELNAAAASRAEMANGFNSPAHRPPSDLQKRKKRKPTSCISFKSLTSCSQS